MRKALLTSAMMLFGMASAPVQAMPVAPLSDAPTSVTPVAMGCGPGFTRGPYGHCHPFHYGYGAPGPYYGYHPYAYRHCWIDRYGYRHCN